MQRRRTARGLAACTLAAAVAVEGLALAEDASTKAAAAEALFRDGRRLMLAGNLDEACPKFVAAQKLDRTVGTALNMGECFERSGKTASAWSSFNEARQMAARQSDAQRADEAERRATQLEAILTRLLLTAPSRGLPAGIEIQIDGQPLDAAVIGTAIPVDPGTHTVMVRRADASSSTTVKAPRGPLTVTIELAAPVAPAAPAAPPPPPASGWNAQRIAGVSIGVMGLAGVVVGSIFGVQAISGKAADGHCDELNHCDSIGAPLRRDGIRAGNISTVTFLIGGLALAGGVTLIITAPSKARLQAGPRAALGLTLGPAAAHVTGIW
jgi:hypothetical protein